MLRFLLDRILPKERPVHVDLPVMNQSADAIDALAVVVEAVGAGRIAPSEAAALAGLVGAYARVMDVAELQERVENIERELKGLKP